MTHRPLKQPLQLLALFVPLALPISSFAQENTPPAGDIGVTGSLTAISQYRLRGVSFSDENPALQGSLTVAHSSGFYVGAWASRLAGC